MKAMQAVSLPRPAVCPPAGVVIDQPTDIVLKYIDADPETRHYTAPTLIGIVLIDAFPCPK
jgi:hypothetical protein